MNLKPILTYNFSGNDALHQGSCKQATVGTCVLRTYIGAPRDLNGCWHLPALTCDPPWHRGLELAGQHRRAQKRFMAFLMLPLVASWSMNKMLSSAKGFVVAS